MTDPNTPSTGLFTPPWTDDTPLDQIPEDHRARVEQERKVKATAAQARPGAGAKTRARHADPARPRPVRTGARRRKGAEVEAAPPEAERVAVVMRTSRYTGRHGRAVPRRTTALVTVERGLKLIMLDDAREATEQETVAAWAADPRVFID